MVIPDKHFRYYVHALKKGAVSLSTYYSLIQIMDAKNQAKDFASEDLP